MEQRPVNEEISHNSISLFKKEIGEKAKDKELFEMVRNIMEEVQIACEHTAKRSPSPNCSADEDVSSGESGGEEDSLQQQQQQQENLEDLQKEMAGLEISEETSTLETLILIVEFYIKNGDVEGFRKNMRRPDIWLMSSSPRPKIVDVLKMADNFVIGDFPFRAILMQKCASALYKYEYVRDLDEVRAGDVTPDDAIRGIEACMMKVLHIFDSLAVRDGCEQAIYLPHFIPVMYDMITNLREIRHADRRLKADREAWGLLYIAYVHGRMGETVEMRDVAITTQKLLEKKSRSSKGAGHSISIFMLSIAERELGYTTRADSACELALKSLQNAAGFRVWDDKVKCVESANRLKDGICLNQKHEV